jgi:hypothetical protein
MTTQLAFQEILKVILHTENENKCRYKRIGILKSQENWRQSFIE